MPSFTGGPNFRVPFGRNQWLRSTQDVKLRSFTLAANTVTSQTIDLWPNQKVLQTGIVIAKITVQGSGLAADVGKVGPYQPAAGAEVNTINVTGGPTGGIYRLTLNGAPTDDLAFNATVAQVQAALDALTNPTVAAGDFLVAGTAATYTITAVAGGNYASQDALWGTVGVALTGGATPAVTVTDTTEAGATAGANDGRQLARNIVGVNNTFLPWQLEYRDVEIAVAYEAVAVEAWLLMYNATGVAVPIDDQTANALRINKALNILTV
jgi:hypothetical protein